MSVSLRPGQIPPGGFVYVDQDGVRHEADTLERLAAKIAAYREQNMFPAGNPHQELIDHYCGQYPQICQKARVPTVMAGTHLASRVQNWIANRYARDVVRTDERTAEKRAAICAQCPHNVAWSNPCKPCEADYRRRAYIVRAGETVSNELDLDACNLLGQCNKTAVWLEEARFTGSETLPPHCWRTLEGAKHV